MQAPHFFRRMSHLIWQRIVQFVQSNLLHRRIFSQVTATYIAQMLQEPKREGRRILRQSLRIDRRLQRTYAKLLSDKNATLTRVAALCTGDLDAVNHWLRPGSARILASAHTADYLLGVLVLLHQVQDIGDVALIKRKENTRAEQLFMDLASQYCDHLYTFLPDRAGLRAALKHLRGGGCLIMMIDVPMHFDVEGGVAVRFFNQQLIATSAIARLALKTNAIVLPAAMITQKTQTFVSLRQPFQAGDDLDLSVADITQRLMRDVEHWVRLAPDTWMIWGHLLYWITCSEEHAQAAGSSQSHQVGKSLKIEASSDPTIRTPSEPRHNIASSATRG